MFMLRFVERLDFFGSAYETKDVRIANAAQLFD